uniref:hypothetical protein n=1 Tax=Amycolatopsis sp. CA-290885 TaxID=3239925 RepID=UPI003F49502B
MTAKDKKGLPDDFDPFSRRQAAANSFLPPPPPADDEPDAESQAPDPSDQEESTSQSDSNNASNSASIDADRKEVRRTVTVTTEKEPAPPRTREPRGRTQMNARVLTTHFKALKRYQHKHGATLQAVVDQMVAEYLDSRGLLPDEDDAK